MLAKPLVPLACLFILAACGGSARREQVATRVVEGQGFSFSAPQGWSTAHTAKGVVVRRGKALVSATTFRLLKPYDPGSFDRVAVELDRAATKLAVQAGGKVTESVTTTVDGRKVRAYRYTAGGYATRIGFLLRGRQEVQLLCRAPARADDPDGACGLLFESFSAP